MYIHGIALFCMIYVNDCLLFSKEDNYIDALVDQMCDQQFLVEYKDKSITGFLVLDIAKTVTGNVNTIKFKTACHINRLLVITGMNELTTKETPAIPTPIGTDIYGYPCKGTDSWSYEAALGMIHYLSRNKRPDITLDIM